VVYCTMLQFYKTKNSLNDEVSINPNYVTQIESIGSGNWSMVTMNSGKQHLVNENCYKLTDKLEKLANYDGC